MPNVRSQRVYTDEDGGALALEIVASDGRAFTVTRSQLLAIFLTTPGTLARRRRRVIAALRLSILLALGREQVRLADLHYDFDEVTGAITHAQIGPG